MILKNLWAGLTISTILLSLLVGFSEDKAAAAYLMTKSIMFFLVWLNWEKIFYE